MDLGPEVNADDT